MQRSKAWKRTVDGLHEHSRITVLENGEFFHVTFHVSRCKRDGTLSASLERRKPYALTPLALEAVEAVLRVAKEESTDDPLG